MAQSSENVIPTLRDYFNSQKPGEEDEFMFCRVPPRPTKMGNKAKERHGFFNQGSKERSRRNISDAEKFSVEQYSSGGFFGVRLNTHGKQQQLQRSAKPLGSERNMEPRLQKSVSARMQFPSFMSSSKGSNQSTSTDNSSSTSWFSRIKKMSNPFSNRNPLIPKSGEIKVNGGAMLSRNKSFRKSSPVHLHAHLSMQYELGMPVFTFSLDRPDDVYMASTRIDDNESRFVYSFRYIGGRSNKNLGEQRSNVSGIESSLIGQMQVSTQICLEAEPYEDPVESTLSEFVLFDIARARRSGFKHEKLSRQNSFRRGLDPSQSIYSETANRVFDGSFDSNLQQENSFSRGLSRSLSKHSETSVSDPWPASTLHPGLEIAAIVIRDSCSSNDSFMYMKNCKLSRREMKVIVPAGNHGLPDTENSCPTPILQRWRSGGGCDCSGWDMGCHLFVLESPETCFAEEPELINNRHGLELFIEGGKENIPAMTMALIREGHYVVNFHAKLSALQAFSVCVAELHRTEVSRGERSNSLSRCSSLRELIDMATPVNRDTREEVLSSFMPNVTFSPISRV
ncbi:unnamed protein product [Arabis nemorensis]|uniref:Uncharacterized protein n=1 Tax=Arabis nemorensis TaxID=586526 RepID=A0A565B4X5_9BRAS|nr:unnamed protein product [Arabis nemorensis]